MIFFDTPECDFKKATATDELNADGHENKTLGNLMMKGMKIRFPTYPKTSQFGRVFNFLPFVKYPLKMYLYRLYNSQLLKTACVYFSAFVFCS